MEIVGVQGKKKTFTRAPHTHEEQGIFQMKRF